MPDRTRRISVALWIAQALLAVLFLFTGGMKLGLPAAVLMKQSSLPLSLMRFVGLAEVVGAIGLVVPALTRIQTALTPLAAAGLVIIMVGATVFSVRTMGVLPALFPFVVGILAAWIAYGRWRVAPIPSKRTQPLANSGTEA